MHMLPRQLHAMHCGAVHPGITLHWASHCTTLSHLVSVLHDALQAGMRGPAARMLTGMTAWPGYTGRLRLLQHQALAGELRAVHAWRCGQVGSKAGSSSSGSRLSSSLERVAGRSRNRLLVSM